MKLIPLTKGFFAKVSDSDYKYLRKFKWHVGLKKRTNTHYAIRNSTVAESGKRSKVQMHRVIMGISDPKTFIYFKDRDGLNCQRNNLKKATLSQIAMRRRHIKKHTSKYLGVSLKIDKKKGTKRWRTTIMVNRKCVYHKYYDTQIECAIAYNKAVKKYHGKFATLNIIKNGQPR